jgi:transcriptional regulator with XRE-family HTH domain
MTKTILEDPTAATRSRNGASKRDLDRDADTLAFLRAARGPAADSDPAATSISLTELGVRIRTHRQRQGLSVRDLAERAGIDKNTVLRIEKGLPTSYNTLVSIGEALNTNIARLTLPDNDPEVPFAVHTHEMDEWRSYAPPGGPNDPAPPGDLDDTTRKHLAEEGAGAFLSVLKCHLPAGRVRSSLLELYDETHLRSHSGEEFVYCLRGRVRIKVADRAFTLSAGESATFWSAEKHNYAPAEGPIPADGEPALLLSVRVDMPDHSK